MRKKAICLAGPDELAAKVLDARRQAENEWPSQAELDDDSIRHLVKLLYHASLLPEEGRFSRFRVVHSRSLFGHTVEFETEPHSTRLETPDDIRKLAPAIAEQDSALNVMGCHKFGFYATDVIDLKMLSAGGTLDRELKLEPPVPAGHLIVRVDGPGELRVCSESRTVFHLRGGTIRELTSYWHVVAPFQEIIDSIAQTVLESIVVDRNETKINPTKEQLINELSDLWAGVLSVAIAGRHGGAFIILPDADNPHVRLNYRISCDLVDCFRSTIKFVLGHDDPKEVDALWRTQRDHLRCVARMVGRLASTDGCVVFDKTLKALSFGAKLNAPPSSNVLLVESGSGKTIDDEVIDQQWGTRHRSACRLVQAVPGAIAFVVSQDGGLIAFYHGNGHVVRANHLDAWPSVAEMI